MNIREAMGGVCRELRLERGLTLRQLSIKTSVGYSYISQLEVGQKDGSSEIWESLAKGLGVPVSELLITAGIQMAGGVPETPAELLEKYSTELV
jgi:transcriptional regulator with XRE-family HTH domain